MPKQVTKNIKINLDVLMEKKGMNIQELHDASGISRTIISELLRSKPRDIRLETVNKLCKALDCKIGDLIEFKK